MAPHIVSKPMGIGGMLWLKIRGVNAQNWRRRCARCGFTGQAHYNIVGPFSCRRFKNDRHREPRR